LREEHLWHLGGFTRQVLEQLIDRSIDIPAFVWITPEAYNELASDSGTNPSTYRGMPIHVNSAIDEDNVTAVLMSTAYCPLAVAHRRDPPPIRQFNFLRSSLELGRPPSVQEDLLNLQAEATHSEAVVKQAFAEVVRQSRLQILRDGDGLDG